MKDLYQSLGVARNATAAREIKRAYRNLTKKHHPDKNPGNKAAEDRFKEVPTAYDVLGDEAKRKLYDEFGEVSLTQGFDPARARAYRGQSGFGAPNFHDFGEARETSFDDLLSRLFGGGRVRGGASRRAQRGQDITGGMQVPFMDGLRGATVPLRVRSPDGKARTLDVKVPQGVAHGDKLRLRGQGGEGDPRGDVMPSPFGSRTTPGSPAKVRTCACACRSPPWRPTEVARWMWSRPGDT